ncbi:syndecan-2 [Syngnathus scovelli]|uniref:syndecan-2 n=1 Tax=Syngnathus scovelli TaxID=161590 RepID=UPI002110AA36|nr:syndecan-2 [Syngnathus scovelli]
MRNVCFIVTLGLAVYLSGERIAQAAKTSSQADDLYLDDAGSGGYYPEDDDDFNSGSGSGAGEEVIEETVTVSMVYIAPKAEEPTKDSTKDFTPKVETATVRETARDNTPKKPLRTEAPPVAVTEDMKRNQMTSTTGAPGSAQEPIEVRTENLFQRTEVLAAVIAGGVIGFLFAIFLILLLVYRMRKKDEGSYDLGERKPSGAAYQKAPTKEFYA